MAICGTWVHDYPTISETAEEVDAVVVGRIVGAIVGNTIQNPLTPEDFYAEVNLQVEVEEVLRHNMHTLRDSFELSLILPRVFRPEDLEPAVAAMQATLPRDPVVLLVFLRKDIDDHPDLYTIRGDKALWTGTAHGPLNNPIAESRCAGHSGEEVREQFLEGARSIEELIENLRS